VFQQPSTFRKNTGAVILAAFIQRAAEVVLCSLYSKNQFEEKVKMQNSITRLKNAQRAPTF